MTSLTRTASGFFKIEDSHTIDEIIEAEDPLSMMIPADVTLEKLGKIELNNNRITAFLNGNSSWSHGFRILEPSSFDSLYRVYGNGSFLGVGEVENSSLVPRKVIK